MNLTTLELVQYPTSCQSLHTQLAFSSSSEAANCNHPNQSDFVSGPLSSLCLVCLCFKVVLYSHARSPKASVS